MVGGTVRRTDEDLDVGTQPPSLGGQSLDLLARAGARREQYDTLAHDRKMPTHSGVIAEERDARPVHYHSHRNHHLRHHGRARSSATMARSAAASPAAIRSVVIASARSRWRRSI